MKKAKRTVGKSEKTHRVGFATGLPRDAITGMFIPVSDRGPRTIEVSRGGPPMPAPKRKRLSEEEDAEITAAALKDPDAQPVDELFARRGRPKLANPKQSVLLRLDPDVVARFKAGGEGWQTRMNEALRKAAGLD